MSSLLSADLRLLMNGQAAFDGRSQSLTAPWRASSPGSPSLVLGLRSKVSHLSPVPFLRGQAADFYRLNGCQARPTRLTKRAREGSKG